MMRLPEFALRIPRSIDEASRILASEGEAARLVAGGTDLYPNLKRRHQRAATVVSLRRCDVRGITGDAQRGVTIGAMTTLATIAADPLLKAHYPGFVRAAASISAPSLRHMGTIGGNLCLDTRCTYYNQNEEWREAIDCCMKAEGSICWVAPSSPRCWAISAADSVPPLIALGARIRLVSPAGEREIPLAELYRDDGMKYLTLAPAEILVALVLPPAGAIRSTYWKLRRRGSIDFPVLGVGATLAMSDDGVVDDAHVVLGAVGSSPIVAAKARDALRGKRLDAESIAAAAKAARSLATPLDNTDFAMQWRAKMVEVYVDGALRELGGLPAVVKSPRHGLHALG
jgi:4-hydroxybenzoyl-CoA reductase subunit beta